ncbi:hypothetical protein GCM10009854_49990 [Saccharopolyspora halophila]|uniref:Uncharacterized protein n=1 Tax=Saccharopolyspora halophila TaxID=405551 RepID=A0ABN3GYI5_9PSEU
MARTTRTSGNRFLVTVNPSRGPVTVEVDDERLPAAHPIEDSGVRVDGRELTVPAFGYAVLELR